MSNKRDLARLLYESYKEAWEWEGIVSGSIHRPHWSNLPEGAKIVWENVAERAKHWATEHAIKIINDAFEAKRNSYETISTSDPVE